MKRKIECVEEFHRIYKLGNSEKPIGKLKDGLEKLRFDLMAEENGEYLEAAQKEMLWKWQMHLEICSTSFAGQLLSTECKM